MARVQSCVTLGGCKEGDIMRRDCICLMAGTWAVHFRCVPTDSDMFYPGPNLADSNIAYQLVEDILDYESASTTVGQTRRCGSSVGTCDGASTISWEEHPEMGEIIDRKVPRILAMSSG